MTLWKVRQDSEVIPDEQLAAEYEGLVDVCTVILHHSGDFMRKDGKKVYYGGKVNYIDYVEVEKVKKVDLGMMAAFVGLQGMLDFYVSMSGEDNCECLEYVCDDFNAGPLMSACISKNLTVSLYVDHDGLQSDEIVYMSKGLSLPDVDESEDDENEAGPNESVDVDNEAGPNESVDVDNEAGPKDSEVDVQEGRDERDGTENKEDQTNLLKVSMEKLIDVEVEKVDSDGDISMGDDSELSDYVVDSDDEESDDELGEFVDSDDEESDEVMQKDVKGKKVMSRSKTDAKSVPKKNVFKVFNEKTDMQNIQFHIGLSFKDIPTFRAALRQYAIEQGRSLTFPINNLFKVQAMCKQKECPWVIYGSRVPKNDTVVVKRLHDTHICVRQERVTQATSKYLSQRYEMKLKSDPNWPVQSMIEIIQSEVGCIFTKWQMYRVKEMVARMGDGDAVAQFGELYKYAAEVFRSNPHTTFRIKSKALANESVFQRLYICWNAFKLGMADGCRRVICLDGCHLKTQFGGVLLTAVGIDGNNGMYPIAYAVVEKEKFNSWLWFLELLVSDLGITESTAYLWTVMSDKQKGLVEAVTHVLPYCEHRFCVRHLYANFKLLHKGLALFKVVWAAARATRIVDFEKIMEELKEHNPDAFEWLSKRAPNHWTMSHFNTMNNTAMITNNLSESFNALILQARSRGIIYMLEDIRKKLMKLIGKRRQVMMKHTGHLCPKIQKKLDKCKRRSYGWSASWNGHQEFEVSGPNEASYYVHLGERVCSCRKWQLTGIPCPHAIACLNHMRYKPEEYVAPCYTKDTYLRVYSHFMTPLYGRDEWPNAAQADLPPLVPPTVTKMPGRPKKHKRKLEPGEVVGSVKDGKLKRTGVVMSCNLCKQAGHNIRTCPLNKERVQKKDGLDIPAAKEPKNKKEKCNKKQASGSQVSAPNDVSTSQASAPNDVTTSLPSLRRSPRLKSVHNASEPGVEKVAKIDKGCKGASVSQPTKITKNKGKGKQIASASQPTKVDQVTASSQPQNFLTKLPMQRNLSFSQAPMFTQAPMDLSYTASPRKIIKWQMPAEEVPECPQQ